MYVLWFIVTERLKEIERLINNYLKEKEPTARRKCLIQIQRRLVKSQEYGDEKLQLVGNMIDLVSINCYRVESIEHPKSPRVSRRMIMMRIMMMMTIKL